MQKKTIKSFYKKKAKTIVLRQNVFLGHWQTIMVP